MSLTLNDFALALTTQLTRIADAAEKLAGAQITTGNVVNTANTANTEQTAETPAQKKARLAAEKAAKEQNSAPAVTRAMLNTALVAVKDTISKEAAKALFSPFGAATMSAIEEKDFAAIKQKADEELKHFAEKTGPYAAADESNEDDDL